MHTSDIDEYAQSASREIYCKATFAPDTTSAFEITSTDNLISAEVTLGSADAGLRIGEVISKECTLHFYNPQRVPISGVDPDVITFEDAVFVLTCGFMSGETFHSRDEGKFVVSNVSSSDNWTTIDITAYDYLADLDATYEPTITFPTTPKAVVHDLERYIGLGTIWYGVDGDKYTTLPAEAEPPASITHVNGTVREWLGWMAGLIGCSAIQENESVIFRKPVYPLPYAEEEWDNVLRITKDIQYLGGLQTGMTVKAISISKVVAYWDNMQKVLNSTGGGPSMWDKATLSVCNPFIAASDNLMSYALYGYVGHYYYPLSVKWRGCPGVHWGDTFMVQTGSTETDAIISTIMSHHAVYNGGLYCETEATKNAETEETARPTERVTNSLSEQIANASVPGTNVTDVVVEQKYDTATGFWYRKWSSGICEMWSGGDSNVAVTTASGNIYISSTIAKTLPVSVVNPFAVVTSDSTVWCNVVSCAYTTLKFRLCSTASVTKDFTLRYHIIGLWHDLTEDGHIEGGGTTYADGDEVSY